MDERDDADGQDQERQVTQWNSAKGLAGREHEGALALVRAFRDVAYLYAVAIPNFLVGSLWEFLQPTLMAATFRDIR